MGDAPRTGDGKTGGRKPQKTEMAVKGASGNIMWKLTAKLFGSGVGKKGNS